MFSVFDMMKWLAIEMWTCSYYFLLWLPFFDIAQARERGEVVLPHYCPLEVDIQVPHSSCIDTQGWRDPLLPLDGVLTPNMVSTDTIVEMVSLPLDNAKYLDSLLGLQGHHPSQGWGRRQGAIVLGGPPAWFPLRRHGRGYIITNQQGCKCGIPTWPLLVKGRRGSQYFLPCLARVF